MSSTMIVRHRVHDFDAWYEVFEEHGAVRRDFGLTDVSLHRDEDDPSMVTVILRTNDLGRAHEFADTPDLRETMERAGVASPPEMYFTNDV